MLKRHEQSCYADIISPIQDSVSRNYSNYYSDDLHMRQALLIQLDQVSFRFILCHPRTHSHELDQVSYKRSQLG